MIDPFADDSSSTNEEIQRLWNKLDSMEASGQLEREERQCHREVSTPPPFAETPQNHTMVVTAESKAIKSRLVDEQSPVKMLNLPPFHQTLSSSSSSSSSSSFPMVSIKDQKGQTKVKRAIDDQHKNETAAANRQNSKAQLPATKPLAKKTPPQTSRESTTGDSDSSSTTSSGSSSSCDSSSSSSSSSSVKPEMVVVKSEPPMTVEVRPLGAVHSPLSMPQFGTQSPIPIKASVKLETTIANMSRKPVVSSKSAGAKTIPIKNPYATRKKQTKADDKSKKKSNQITSTASFQTNDSSTFFKNTASASKEKQDASKAAARSTVNNKENKNPIKKDAVNIHMSTSTFDSSSSSSSSSSSPPNRVNPIDNLSEKQQRNHRGRDPFDVTVQDYQPDPEPSPEIDPLLLSPPPYKEKPRPVLHQFSLQNRPLQSRTKMSVASLFPAPMNQLWRNKFSDFNHLQSEVANMLCHSDDNMVVSAPTGAGKTAIFEMALARFISRDLQFHEQSFTNGSRSCMSKHRKVVYFAPSKALCEERYEDWSRRLSQLQLGIEVSMITGDAEPGRSYHDLANSHLILTTPEKWDSILRRWAENFFLIATVKLLLLDEVHLLGDPSRGFCLEAIITRMKHIHNVSQKVNISQAGLSKAR